MAKATEALLNTEKEQEIKNIWNALNQNNDLFEQKIKVTGLKLQEGKEKIDKDGNILTDEFGEPQKWDNTYRLSYVSLNSGGEHSTRITQEQYLNLKLDEVYIASGSIKYVLYKDTYNTTPTVVFEKFTPASELFVTAMLKLEGLKK
ncbi:hypothetical protein CPIN18020_0293 [Campylobacter pinnipediorum subsp. caledonicus]|uniref:hypothetical protein n=1 Tax=Campylobacter pinnipediorum TaxID=1965231 RepID=UPI00099519FF|nr:hypothetical protein [Campylobacter pinnipediorum]AQW85537.1 hypothetical protein CPIN18020_0293 [Campylobacter pinnipediorum subsp. caledonicus]